MFHLVIFSGIDASVKLFKKLKSTYSKEKLKKMLKHLDYVHWAMMLPVKSKYPKKHIPTFLQKLYLSDYFIFRIFIIHLLLF